MGLGEEGPNARGREPRAERIRQCEAAAARSARRAPKHRFASRPGGCERLLLSEAAGRNSAASLRKSSPPLEEQASRLRPTTGSHNQQPQTRLLRDVLPIPRSEKMSNNRNVIINFGSLELGKAYDSDHTDEGTVGDSVRNNDGPMADMGVGWTTQRTSRPRQAQARNSRRVFKETTSHGCTRVCCSQP
ncbi:hypothetical protein MTO96_005946 [Rhipicephalus appendiculatus]